ncbi:MAG TPA: hypothetical protein ENK85_04710 [Saprospiraceae bacterium]|nr:hypothetical protein [Saprospiraceae bacterium]
MGSFLPLIIQLASGALGGNLAGKLMKGSSMGTLWNSIAGIAGGGIGGQVLSMLGMGAASAASSGSFDLSSIISSVAGGGVGGGILMAVIGLVKKAMAKKA